MPSPVNGFRSFQVRQSVFIRDKGFALVPDLLSLSAVGFGFSDDGDVVRSRLFRR